MLRYCLVFLFLSSIKGQFLTVKLGAGTSFHLEDGNPYNNFPYNSRKWVYRDAFFLDGSSYSLTVMLNLNKDINQDDFGYFHIGMSYSEERTRSRAIIYDLVGWGDYFIMRTIAPFIGYSIYLPDSFYNATYFISIGYSKTQYEGLNRENFFFYNTDYINSKSIYISTGITFKVYHELGFDIAFNYFEATVIPESLYADVNSPGAIELLRSGFINDPFFTIRLSIIYSMF